jgi:hypothetical protein
MSDDEDYEYEYGSDNEQYDYGSDQDANENNESCENDVLIEIENSFYGEHVLVF